jgi:trk system potassium uptake protein TrkH
LIVVGGAGFIVLEDLRSRYVLRRTRRLALHTRLVLLSTALLLGAGFVLFLAFEWRNGLAHLPVPDRIAGALFMSVTPRTAGFNTVNYAEVTDASLFVTALLMLVGGSPGSTAGGFKTVSVALLILLFRSRLRGERRVSAFGRTIPSETIQSAASLVAGGFAVLAVSIFLLIVLETPAGGPGSRTDLVALVFEAQSAFGTVGLSMGATPQLGPLARLVVIGLMFLGRLGPPAVVAAMAHALNRTRVELRYGEEDVAIG